MQLKDVSQDLLEMYRGICCALFCSFRTPGSTGWAVLARAPYAGTPETTEFFMEIFSAVLGCREVSAGWKTNSRSSCEGVSKASLDSLRAL